MCVFVCVCVCIGLKGRLFKKEVKDDAEYLVFPLLGGMVVQKQKLNVAQVIYIYILYYIINYILTLTPSSIIYTTVYIICNVQ